LVRRLRIIINFSYVASKEAPAERKASEVGTRASGAELCTEKFMEQPSMSDTAAAMNFEVSVLEVGIESPYEELGSLGTMKVSKNSLGFIATSIFG
jgi:hypothetical protein